MTATSDAIYSQTLTGAEEAIVSRKSVRRFLDKPVDRETVRHLLEVSARAPSGTNMQPWKVYAVAGEVKDALCKAIIKAWPAGELQPFPSAADAIDEGKYTYYPTNYFEPYKSRRRIVGWALYGTLGIERGETEKMNAQRQRNFMFFDAPVGLIFTINRQLPVGSWLDYGMFLQNIMVAARGRGLDTCAQAAFSEYSRVITDALGCGPEEIVMCGMALGYADKMAPENLFSTDREPVEGFTTFLGF